MPKNLFSSFPECHSARRASLPGVAESTLSKSGEKPSPQGRRCPSGRMRGGETHGFQALTHRPSRPPSPGRQGFMAWSWILRLRLMAARRMTALLEGSKNQMGMMGVFSPVLVQQILLTWLYLPVQRKVYRVEGGCFRTFPNTFCSELPDLLM